MSGYGRLAEEQARDVRRLRRQGLSAQAISRQVGIRLGTVTAYMAEDDRLAREATTGPSQQDRQREAMALLASGATLTEAATAAGAPVATVARWRDRGSGITARPLMGREAEVQLAARRGLSMRELARRYGVSARAISRALQRVGEPMPRPRRHDAAGRTEIVWDYVRGSTLRDLAAAGRGAMETLAVILREEGVPRRPGYARPGPRTAPAPTWVPESWATRDPELYGHPTCPSWSGWCLDLASEMGLPARGCAGCPAAAAGEDAPLDPPLPLLWRTCPRCGEEPIPGETDCCLACARAAVPDQPREHLGTDHEAWRREGDA